MASVFWVFGSSRHLCLALEYILVEDRYTGIHFGRMLAGDLEKEDRIRRIGRMWLGNREGGLMFHLTNTTASADSLCSRAGGYHLILVKLRKIVRVQYFVRGGSVGHRSRASSKHLSPHLPVGELDSSGGQTGVALHLQMHVWVSGPQRKPTRC
ncbi:hypothetical protein TNCV_1748891 [Trichonephila clavipes]|nr:hypothetical protein TNCV_1748891 [Trichonephila clavipes]